MNRIKIMAGLAGVLGTAVIVVLMTWLANYHPWVLTGILTVALVFISYTMGVALWESTQAYKRLEALRQQIAHEKEALAKARADRELEKYPLY